MHLNHSYSENPKISHSIMEGNFSFNLSDKMSFILSIEDIEKFIEDGLDFPYNFREYKELVIKNRTVTENYWLKRALLQHFNQEEFDITFDIQLQKLVYFEQDKDKFNSELINEYFTKVYNNIHSYILNKKEVVNKKLIIESNQEGFILQIDGFKLLIDNKSKEIIYNELSKYFNEYFELTLSSLKSRVVEKEKAIDFEFLSTVGLSTVKHMTSAKELNFEDLKNVIDLLIPNKFCNYEVAF